MTARFIPRLIALFLLALLVAGISFFGRKVLLLRDPSQVPTYAFDGFAMGTVLTVKVRTTDEKFAEKAADEALSEVRRIHGIFDPGDRESELSRLNEARGSARAIRLSGDMSLVLGEALRLRKLSNGHFEPAMGELIELWGFGDERKKLKVPDLAAVCSLVGSSGRSREITLSEDGASVTLGMSAGSLDMGGVAKGYAVDRAIAVLKARGVKNALVNLGGEIGVLGAGSNGRSWRIGVQHPRNTSMHIGVIELTDGNFVATSGDYERYFFENGRRYHHILDPDTGYPAARGAVSVTVITTSCLEADALATAAFVMGAESGSDFLESSGAMGLILCSTAAGPEKDPAVADISYKATESFLRLMTPDLEGLPLP